MSTSKEQRPPSRLPPATRLVAAVVLLAATGLGGAPAVGQTAHGFSLDRFSPSGGGSDWFALESLDFRGHLRPTGGITLDWADQPLAVNESGGGTYGNPIVASQTYLHLGLAMMLRERIRVGLNVPVVIDSAGNEQMLGGLLFRAPGRTVLADIRAAGDIILLGRHRDLYQLAAGLEILLPSGVRSQYTGDGVVRVAPRLLAAGQWRRYVYALRLGFQTRGSIPQAQRETIRLGHEVTGGLAVGVRPRAQFVVGAELYGSSVVTGGNFLRESVSPLEVLFSARFEPHPRYHVMLGVAPGITSAIGSPAIRVCARLEYLPAPPAVPL